MTTSIDFVTLLTIIYVLVADGYVLNGPRLLHGKPGKQPAFRDSEVMTRLLAMDFLPFPSESQFLGYIRANHPDVFPQLLDQSQFNRRARGLRLVLAALPQAWVSRLGGMQETHFLLDTKPVPVVGYKRSKRHSDFAGSANYGFCSSKNLHYSAARYQRRRSAVRTMERSFWRV